MSASVVAVHRSPDHLFSKEDVDRIELLPGLGVSGDTHSGARVQHRSSTGEKVPGKAIASEFSRTWRKCLTGNPLCT